MSDETAVSDKEQQEEELAEGTLLSHLIELRSRLIKISVAVVGMSSCCPFPRRFSSWCRNRSSMSCRGRR